ncbi:head-tail connector protein [Clostridium tagluense]|uniref:Phage gp6-like head-tail connector protein n=1 Tax=Clostridium tagluense TaxID=360422 RepID=A0A401UM40_9CLOT|nr:head-tail connector protein [Clostridium tagluense]GCD10587.1 hypothetical protein Ctaglu_22100 [Clostridium tagluense]
MLLELQETKEFLNLDFESDDIFIQQLILTSEDFIIDSIGLKNYNSKIINKRFERKARLCCLTIIQDCYDNRTMVSDNNEKLRYIVGGMLLQMKYGTYEVII